MHEGVFFFSFFFFSFLFHQLTKMLVWQVLVEFIISYLPELPLSPLFAVGDHTDKLTVQCKYMSHTINCIISRNANVYTIVLTHFFSSTYIFQKDGQTNITMNLSYDPTHFAVLIHWRNWWHLSWLQAYFYIFINMWLIPTKPAVSRQNTFIDTGQ